MAFCGQCGAEAAGRFCAKCGGTLAEPAFALPVPPPASPVAASFPGDNIVAGLTYIVPPPLQLLLMIVPPLRRDRVVLFHLLQSLFVGILFFFLDRMLTSMDPLWETGPSAVRFLHVVWGMLVIALVLATFIKRRLALPGLGQIAERIAWPGGQP
jgi:uncharacterized membrane protein